VQKIELDKLRNEISEIECLNKKLKNEIAELKIAKNKEIDRINSECKDKINSIELVLANTRNEFDKERLEKVKINSELSEKVKILEEGLENEKIQFKIKMSEEEKQKSKYDSKIRELHEKYEQLLDEVTCPVCHYARKEKAAKCEHCMCRDCYKKIKEKLKNCPLCRSVIDSGIFALNDFLMINNKFVLILIIKYEFYA